MKTQSAIRALVLAALLSAPLAPAQAAGPFQVRRATSADAVQSAPPVATVLTSPFDGDLAAMVDESSYFYGVYDASNSLLAISVQANPATHTIRIGFDDGDGASAPVNATASSVGIAPASIAADGLQAASITIVPRDAGGVLLGRGLAITIDASLLWPATLSGPVVDFGDGSYGATAVALVPGTGTVFVTVESVALTSSPAITATALDPSASLRDLAMDQLSGLAAGPLAALLAAAGPGTPQADALAAAQARINDALAKLANDDPAHDDNVVKTDLDAVLSLLASVLASPGSLDPMDVQDVMDDILGVARFIADWHIERATGTCGACDASDNPRKVCDAMAAMAHADAMRAAISPDWDRTVDEYARAVELALQAFHDCR